jgi:hypothetical protein
MSVSRDGESRVKTDRARLRRVIAALEPGDVLTVTGSTGWRARPVTC